MRSKLTVTTWVQHPVDSHPFCFMSIRHPFPELWLFQNLTLKIKGQDHGWGQSSKSQCGSNILLTHIPFFPCQSGIPFLSNNYLQNLTLKIKGQVHGWGHSSKSQCGSNILSTHIPFVPCESALPLLRYSIFEIWPWNSRGKVKWPWCCTTTGLDNSVALRMVSIARPPYQRPVILSGTPELGWAPLTCGCWQINSISANIGHRNSIRILNQYPFWWKILIRAWFISFIKFLSF